MTIVFFRCEQLQQFVFLLRADGANFHLMSLAALTRVKKVQHIASTAEDFVGRALLSRCETTAINAAAADG